MEFKSLKNIETSFKHIRLYVMVFAGLCLLVSAIAIFASFSFARKQVGILILQRIDLRLKGGHLVLRLLQHGVQLGQVQFVLRNRGLHGTLL